MNGNDKKIGEAFHALSTAVNKFADRAGPAAARDPGTAADHHRILIATQDLLEAAATSVSRWAGCVMVRHSPGPAVGHEPASAAEASVQAGRAIGTAAEFSRQAVASIGILVSDLAREGDQLAEPSRSQPLLTAAVAAKNAAAQLPDLPYARMTVQGDIEAAALLSFTLIRLGEALTGLSSMTVPFSRFDRIAQVAADQLDLAATAIQGDAQPRIARARDLLEEKAAIRPRK